MLCAVAPLAAVGFWLTQTAARSGALLLQAQLDTMVDRAADAARERWRYRQSDASLLANNEPIHAALRTAPGNADVPPYVQRAFATMPNIAGVEVRDARGQLRWSLGQVPSLRPPPGIESQANTPGSAAQLAARAPIRDESSGVLLGEVVAFVRIDALVPALARSQVPGGDFVAVHDRTSGAWMRPVTLSPTALDSAQFTWDGRPWLAARRSLDAPAIDIVAAAATDPFVTPFAHTAAVGATALATVAIVVMVLTMFVTTRLTRSLRTLAEGADAVARGEFDTRVDDRADDEVGRVARTFNTMAESIRGMLRERSQREAVAAMGELAATLAHQLRSPATAIRIDVQRAHDKLHPDSSERALLARALEQLDRLERAVAGSLKVARSAGAEFQDIDVREPLQRALAGVQDECTRLGATIDDRGVSGTPLVVRGDAPSLEQLLANTLVNAIQAAGPGGRTTVAAASSVNGEALLTIHDNGPGMTPDILARAGEPLFSTKPEGTGLGLAIAQRIAAAHRGVVTIDSAPGAGTTVRIELPLIGL
jgi:signal transduction histidine kinase